MNALLSQGLTNLLFSVIAQESARILAEHHDDESALNRRAARILAMAHNKRALHTDAPQDPSAVLGCIESEARRALGEAPQRHVERLNAIVETAQRKHLLEEDGRVGTGRGAIPATPLALDGTQLRYVPRAPVRRGAGADLTHM